MIDINPQFQNALDIMNNTSKSIFITGRAGTGKSTLLSHFCSQTSKNLVLLASTGVAALNIKGQTIHSFFNFYIDVTPQKIKDKKTKPRDPKIYKRLDTIIIDEISMVRADLLDCIDVFLKIYGPNPGEPFGGVQMIFVGDLYQLPPVVTSEERNIFSSHYRAPYFFSAHVFNEFGMDIIELEKVYRQKDQDFVSLLNRIRSNSVTMQDIELLNTRHIPEFKASEDEFYVSLTTTNKKADEINDAKLRALPGRILEYPAEVKGEFGKEYFPTSTKLQLKLGAQIMMLNNDPKKRWVNGSIGIIEDIQRDDKGETYLRVRLQDNNKLVNVSPFTWEVYKFYFDGEHIASEAVGTFSQFPARLSWAVTIHKSQGKTFDRVIIDIGNGTFVSGQTYVALSRCTSFEGIVLSTAFKRAHIQSDYRIANFFKNYQPAKPRIQYKQISLL